MTVKEYIEGAEKEALKKGDVLGDNIEIVVWNNEGDQIYICYCDEEFIEAGYDLSDIRNYECDVEQSGFEEDSEGETILTVYCE